MPDESGRRKQFTVRANDLEIDVSNNSYTLPEGRDKFYVLKWVEKEIKHDEKDEITLTIVGYGTKRLFTSSLHLELDCWFTTAEVTLPCFPLGFTKINTVVCVEISTERQTENGSAHKDAQSTMQLS